ncbi:MAG: endolytic transglycosylase MltG [Parcubacteria group bacterium]|nr:endolytic transglycosylase MltG [Parcubacteria group bacterium]
MRLFLSIAIPIIVFLLLLGGLFLYLESPRSETGAPVSIAIEEGTSVRSVAKNLDEQGIIRHRLGLLLYFWLNRDESIKAGEYILAPTMSVAEIAKILVSGETVLREHDITFLEGWDIRAMASYLEEENGLPQEDFIRAVSPSLYDRATFAFLDWLPADVHTLEGFLFPDTYRIFNDASAQDIIEKALANFGRRLPKDFEAKIREQNLTPYEGAILASIVEREVRPEDQPAVAGVFYNRLAIGMKLDSDATISYALNKPTLRPTLEETEIDSPYNTYRVSGLPPTPIGNPGRAALEAVLNPLDHDYLYFLTALTGERKGETIFAKTLEEHNQNRARYF